MKISVSNIAWGNGNFDDFINLIKENNCEGIELAPSLIWDEPINSNQNERSVIKKKLEIANLNLQVFTHYFLPDQIYNFLKIKRVEKH